MKTSLRVLSELWLKQIAQMDLYSFAFYQVQIGTSKAAWYIDWARDLFLSLSAYVQIIPLILSVVYGNDLNLHLCNMLALLSLCGVMLHFFYLH